MFNYDYSVSRLKELKETDYYKNQMTVDEKVSINDALLALMTLKDIDELLETENSACGRLVKDIMKEHGF